jgi:hypothetical protein
MGIASETNIRKSQISPRDRWGTESGAFDTNLLTQIIAYLLQKGEGMMALAWERYEGQVELFPLATPEEIKVAKSLLSRYRRMAAAVEEFERHGVNDLAPKALARYNAYKLALRRTDQAIRLIADDDIRRMIEFRYIKGQSHAVTIGRFNLWHPSTVDRKINRGIESVANTLSMWG